MIELTQFEKLIQEDQALQQEPEERQHEVDQLSLCGYIGN